MAYTDFYVTKEAGASDLNGGGPTSGPGGAPVVTKANCSSNVAGTQITNADADGWGGAANDDWLVFDTAGTKGHARITNVAGNVLTVTPAVTGSLAGKNVNVGGHWATVDHAWSIISVWTVNGSSHMPCINVQYNATPYSEQVQHDNSGTSSIPLTTEGFETTAHDGCPNGNLPTISSAAGGLAGVLYCAANKDYLRVYNLRIEATGAGIEAMNLSADYSHFRNLRLKATGAGANALLFFGFANELDNIYVEDAADAGLSCSNWTYIHDCVVESAGGIGISAGYLSVFTNCLVLNSGSHGISLAGQSTWVSGCSVYNSGGDGIYVGSYSCSVRNCILEGNIGDGIGAPSNAVARMSWVDYNAFFDNGAEYDAFFDRTGDHDVTLTGSAFVNAGSGDFHLNDIPGAGAACRNAGFPGPLLDGVHEGHLDIGALQPVRACSRPQSVQAYRESDSSHSLERVAIAWMTGDDGEVDARFDGRADRPALTGLIHRIVTVPGDGRFAPEPNYDVRLEDENGTDALEALGSNRSASSIETAWLFYLDGYTSDIATLGPLNLRIQNAGAQRTGQFILYAASPRLLQPVSYDA